MVYGKIKQDIANILSMLCKRKWVKIIQEDLEYFQITLKEYIAPFTGESVKQNK